MTLSTGAATRAVWQVSAGPPSRSYLDVFLKHGVTLVGPGDAGPWKPERDDVEFEGGFVRRFASEMAVGDIVLLRTGIATIAAVGLIASEYLYVNAFDDVNGWDLQHARRVRWSRLPEDHAFDARVFGANPPRCSRAWSEDVIDFAHRYINSPPTRWQTVPLPELPAEDPPLSEVPEHLRGMVGMAADLVPLMQDRQAFGDDPSESELVAHFVVPFLEALGWRPEHIGVQWRHVDVAVFRTLPRTPENCRFVIEAKRLGAGVEGALQQARRYVEVLGCPLDVIVTDGVRYRLYDGQRDFEPIGYANLARLKQPASALFAYVRRA